MPDDRAIILQRRALLLASTLATLGGCAKPTPAPASPAGPVVAVPQGEPEPAGASDDAGAGALPARGDGGRFAGDLPPLDVPDGVGPEARKRYETLARTMNSAYLKLDDLEAGVPGCSADDAACQPKWTFLAEGLLELDQLFRFFYVCPGSSAEARAYHERHEAHMKAYTTRRSELEAKIAAAHTTDAARKAWEKTQHDVRYAHPVPCLSFACADW